MSSITHIRAQNYVSTPWRNGRGTTQNIAFFPDNSPNDFVWRASLADITDSGPFSHFPGISRCIVQLEGPPVHLLHPDRSKDRNKTLEPLKPYLFSGDERTLSHTDGPARDFNFMWRADILHVDIEEISIGAKEERAFELGQEHEEAFLFCAQGEVFSTFKVKEYDALRIRAKKFTLETEAMDAKVFLFKIRFVSPAVRRTYFPDWQDFLEPSRKRTATFLDAAPHMQAGISALALAILMLVLSMITWNFGASADWVVSRDAVFVQKEYWRLFTALFVHKDFLHFLHNVPMFLIFGWLLRAYFGASVFPFLSLLAGMVTNFLTIYFYAPQTRLLGASGMVYAMIAMWLVLYLRFECNTPLKWRLIRTLGFALALLFPETYEANVSYLAHGWGFMVGAILGFLPREKKHAKAIVG